jgi:5-methylcytosine-specific restriction endonuclease McrA
MRPVRRGLSPLSLDYADYQNAKPDLVARLGPYCSFCERPVFTQLAVEHIQPKGLPQYAPLIGRWTNFLLACVNCNSTKKVKNVVLADVLLPDRDNTSAVFCYLPD